MIDTDKYEGHTPAPWGFGKQEPPLFLRLAIQAGKAKSEDIQLLADAPLLLAEVKRLRYHLQKAEELLEQWNENGEGEYYWDGEEYRFRYEGEEE